MLTLSDPIVAVLEPFVSLFHVRTWHKVPVLLIGTILTSGQRTVTAALRIMGLSDDRSFARLTTMCSTGHRGRPLRHRRLCLSLLVEHLGRGDGPLVFGIDETLERRRGPRIKARGIYRDAVRSSRSCTVQSSGLRWVSMMWLGHVPWADRFWALPLLTVLAPSERFTPAAGKAPQEGHRLGAPDDNAAATLVAQSLTW